ncbi:MAG: hypothetical protein JSS68_12410 [Actinobacteria bacterium]|nr:hypothetical protein [Actinomycetota bacterium]
MTAPGDPAADRWIHVARLDLEDGWREDFLGWYRGTHVPELLRRPGWEAAHLYACTDGEPRELAIFDLGSEAITDQPISASPLVGYPEDHRIRNYQGRTMRRISSRGADPRDAGLVNFVTTEIRPAAAAAFDAWYEEVHVPEITACPGWLGNERYEGIDGEPRFLAFYGLEDEQRPFATPEFERAVGWDQFFDDLLGYHGFRIFRKTDACSRG